MESEFEEEIVVETEEEWKPPKDAVAAWKPPSDGVAASFKEVKKNSNSGGNGVTDGGLSGDGLTADIGERVKPTARDRARDNALEESTKKTFIEQGKLFANPTAREKYYQRLEEKGYDTRQIREVGERNIAAQQNFGAIEQAAINPTENKEQDVKNKYTYANALSDLGRYQESATVLQELEQQGVASPEIYQSLSYNATKLGNRELAAEYDAKAQANTSISVPNPTYSPEAEQMGMTAGAIETLTPGVGMIQGFDHAMHRIKEAKDILMEQTTTRGEALGNVGKAALKGTVGIAGGAIGYLMNTTPIGLAFTYGAQGATAVAKTAIPENGTLTADEAVGYLMMPISTGISQYERKTGEEVSGTMKDVGELSDLILVGVIGAKLHNAKGGGMSKENQLKANETAQQLLRKEKVSAEDLRNLSQYIYKEKTFRESILNPFTEQIGERKIKSDNLKKSIAQNPEVLEPILAPEIAKVEGEIAELKNKAVEHDSKVAEQEIKQEQVIEEVARLEELLPTLPAEAKVLVEQKIQGLKDDPAFTMEWEGEKLKPQDEKQERSSEKETNEAPAQGLLEEPIQEIAPNLNKESIVKENEGNLNIEENATPSRRTQRDNEVSLETPKETAQAPVRPEGGLEETKAKLEREIAEAIAPPKSEAPAVKQEKQTVAAKETKVESPKPAEQEQAAAPKKEGFTESKVINRDYKILKEKLGEKKVKKYFEQVDRLIDANKNEIVEYRANGVVVKEGDRYIFKALGDTDLKNWRLIDLPKHSRDITEQFVAKETTPTPTKEVAPTPEVKEVKAGEKEKLKFERNTDKIKELEEELSKVAQKSRKSTNLGATIDDAIKATKIVIQLGYYKAADIAKFLVEKGMNDYVPFIQEALKHIKENFELTEDVKKALGGGEIKEKAFLGKVYEAKNATELKESVEEHGLHYEVENWRDAQGDADAFIAEVGIDNALDAVRKNLMPVESASKAYVFAKAVEIAKNKAYAETDPVKKMDRIREAADLFREMDEISRGAGRWNAALYDIYQNSDLGYQVESLINKARAANKGEDVSPRVQQELNKMAEEITRLNEALAKQKEKATQEEADISFEKISDAKKIEDAVKKSKPKEAAKKIADKIIEGNKNRKDKEADLIFESAKRDIVAQRVAKEVASDTSNVNEKTKIDKAVDKVAKEGLIKPENIQKAKDFFNELTKDKTKLEVSKDGKLSIPEGLLYELVEGGIDNINDLAKAVRERLTDEEQAKFSERNVRDEITKYGKQKLPSADEIKKKISELKRDGQLVSGLEDALNSKRPSKSGFIRPKVTDWQRQMIKKIKDAMKDHPEDAADVERKWASANDRIKTTLENKISDLQRQIDAKARDTRSETSFQRTEENKALQEQINDLNKVLDELVGKKEQSFETKVNNAVKAIERAEEEYNRRIKEKDFDTVQSKLESPLIDAARAARDIVKEEFEAARDEAAPKESALQKLIDSQEDFTKEIEKEQAKEKPDAEKLSELEKKKELTRGQISNLVDAVIKLNTDPAQVEVARKIKAKEAAIKNLKEKLSKNDLSAKDKSQGATSPELKALEKEHEALVKDLTDRRKDANKKSQAEIESDELGAAIKQKEKTLQELIDKLNTNNLSKKTRTAQSYDNDPQVKLLSTQISQANKLLQQKRNALIIKKSAAQKATETALKSAQRELDKVTDKIKKQNLAYDTKQSKVIQTTQLRAAQQALKDARKVLQVAREQAGLAEINRGEIYKKAIQRDIAKMNEQLRTGVFDKERLPRKEDAVTAQLEIEKSQKKAEVDLAIEKIRLANRTAGEQVRDVMADVSNIPRGILASGDLSAMLRQGIELSISHPKLAAEAFVAQFKFLASEKNYADFIHGVKTSAAYFDMKKAELYLSEPTTKLTAKEETFMSNLIHKIPILGFISKASERAYTGFLNKLRVDVFNDFKQTLIDEGFSGKELDAELKAYASFVNNSTGRGKLPEGIAGASQVFNGLFFSPKFFASRVNRLYQTTAMPFQEAAVKLGYKDPKGSRARREAMKAMMRYVGVGLGVLTLAKLGGTEVDDEETSSDFGKIKTGNIRRDIWSGYQQIVVLLSRLWQNKMKNLKTGEVKELGGSYYENNKVDVAFDFMENKGAPPLNLLLEAGRGVNKRDKQWYGIDMAKKGEDFNVAISVADQLQFMWQHDVWDIYDEEGLGRAVETGLESFSGIGVQHFNPNQLKSTKGKTSPTYKRAE